MSHLFLGKARVYKLVRAVDHVYADLVSVESRRSACWAELEANRALAPGIYVAARPIVRGLDGTVRLGGRGEVVDWMVEMRRSPTAPSSPSWRTAERSRGGSSRRWPRPSRVSTEACRRAATRLRPPITRA